MLIRRLREIKNNKKGFSLVEAIAVVAIIGILSVIIASLLASSTKYYSKNHDEVSAKEISKVVEKEIVRLLAPATQIHLQGGTTESDIPRNETIYRHTTTGTFIDASTYSALIAENNTESSNYEPISSTSYKNSPFGNRQNVTRFSSLGDESFLYFATSTTGADKPFFSEQNASGNPVNATTFYGGYYISVYFKAMKNGGADGKYQSIIVYCDVYDSQLDVEITYNDPSSSSDYGHKNISKHRIYTSSGRIVSPIRMAGAENTIYSYSQTVVETRDGKTDEYYYKNNVNESTRYTYLHFITV